MYYLPTTDPEIAAIINNETTRQQDKLELIASENFVSEAILEATGSTLTNKYAEGYPGKRYYGGCEFVDQAEELARQRAGQLFGARFANVQPHSGAQANMAVYFALLQTGSKILTMDLAHGGHLTHGSKVNFSGKLYEVYHYGVSEKDEQIDYNSLEQMAREVKPDLIVAGASAYPRTLNFSRFAMIAQEVGAYLMVDMAHIAGLVAAGLHPNPVEWASVVTTTTHKTLRGPRGGMVLTNDSDIAQRIDKAVFPGMQGGPLMHVIAAKAVAFKEALSPSFQQYQKQVVNNAAVLAAALAQEGFRLVAGGTDTHLLLVDLTSQSLTGKEAEAALDVAGITVNKNTIPFETRSPFITSGIRIGTPAVTTRGMGEEEMKQIAKWINSAIINRDNKDILATISREVKGLRDKFPLYPDRNKR